MGMRLVLVVVQFSISIALIIGSGVVFQQIQFIKNKDVGYDRDQVLTISLNAETAQRFQPLVERLEQSPAILSWSASGNVPGRGMGRTGIQPDGVAQTDPWVVSVMSMDENFLETMGIELVAGRNFSPEFGTDAEQAVILNQAAVEAIGWDDPIGKTFNEGRRTVVGVIADFHFATLRHVVEPIEAILEAVLSDLDLVRPLIITGDHGYLWQGGRCAWALDADERAVLAEHFKLSRMAHTTSDALAATGKAWIHGSTRPWSVVGTITASSGSLSSISR